MEESKFEILAKSRKIQNNKNLLGINKQLNFITVQKLKSYQRFTQELLTGIPIHAIRFKLVMKAGNLNLIRVR